MTNAGPPALAEADKSQQAPPVAPRRSRRGLATLFIFVCLASKPVRLIVKNKKQILAACISALLVSGAPAAAEDKIRLSTGINFSSGDYGTGATTEILSAPFRVAWRTGDFEFSASVSYITIEGAGDVIPGEIGPIITLRCEELRLTRPLAFERFCRDLLETPEPDTFRNSGMGDVVLGFSWALPQSLTGDWFIDVGARVKLPTASEQDGLGTGKTDVTASLDIAYPFESITPFAGVSYRFFGDPVLDDGLGTPFTIDLEDGLTASAGFMYLLPSQMSVTMAYDYVEKTIVGSSAGHEATLSIGAPIGDNGWRLSGYGVAGLTRSSPDFVVGLSLSYGFPLN